MRRAVRTPNARRHPNGNPRTTADSGFTGGGRGASARGLARRLTAETKSFFETSELWLHLPTVIAILIAGNSIGGEEGGGDLCAADKVWLYITLLTIGYMLSCGIAKSGVCEPYWSERGDRDMGH